VDSQPKFQDLEYLYVRLALNRGQAARLRHLCDLQTIRPTELVQQWVSDQLHG
jgi:hypothetical protein